MTITAPSLNQIKAKVTSIREKLPQAKVIAIHSSVRWTDKTGWTEGDHDYAITQCDSPLSFRMALREPTDENTTRVLITGLKDQDLGDDVLLRLAKRRLLEIDSWEIVRSKFEATAVDPRLTQYSWFAEALLEFVPHISFSPARGGFLDAETAWPLLLSHRLGFQDETPDLTSLLRWSLDQQSTERFRNSDPEFQSAAITWLTEKAGSTAAVILHCIQRLQQADAVPLGLAASVVYHPSAAGRLDKAVGRLEGKYFRSDQDANLAAGHIPDAEDMQRWSTTASEVVRSLREQDSKLCEKMIVRGDEILQEIGAADYAWLSDTSRLGFDQRLAQIGNLLSQLLESEAWNNLESVLDAYRAVQHHEQAARETRRLQRVEMAVRLVRWLSHLNLQTAAEAESFEAAAEYQLHEGGFVDWARLSLRSGDPVPQLSTAYAQLFERVTQIRQQQAKTFAKLLTDWTASGSNSKDVIPVEQILDQIVAPLAENGLVLAIVLDGMSVAVMRELLADLTRHEWLAISEPGRKFNRPGLATIPSVTEFSRTSLLSGKLGQGTQDSERKLFANHPGLLAHSRSGSPPVLFHKAGLSENEDSGLASEVRKEIASTHRRVVGVVINAVDDHLLKGEQIDTLWTRDEIKGLSSLLREARIARRMVVLLSDHGHVLDCHAQGRVYQDAAAGGERWRTATGEPEQDEFLVEGPRVMTADQKLIAPWSESIRYGMKKNGYHGGLTPQEMVAPIAVLASTDELPVGWSEQPVDIPDWWDESTTVESVPAEPVPRLKPVEEKPRDTLFPLEEEEETVPETVEGGTPDWIARLIKCIVFEEQKQFGGRGVPTDEDFIRLLTALDTRGGKLTSVALARTLEIPGFRLPGFLAKAERVLNIDGYDVLRRDEASDTIELNRSLLLTQFDLVES
ncbi:MAG: hypothetical protein CME32_16270 [Gimesia sp.]|nr:hypothetical protein [Gimesia sp.]